MASLSLLRRYSLLSTLWTKKAAEGWSAPGLRRGPYLADVSLHLGNGGQRPTFQRPRSFGSISSHEPAGFLRSGWNKMQNMLRPFMAGATKLKNDIMTAYKLRRKQRNSGLALNRNEKWHLRKLKEELGKILPIMSLFMIPLIGYLAPMLAYAFPKQLLTRHFWTPSQRRAYLLEEDELRRFSLDWLQEALRDVENQKSDLDFGSIAQAGKMMTLGAKENTAESKAIISRLGRIQGHFQCPQGSLCLDKLSPDHLVRLAQAHGAIKSDVCSLFRVPVLGVALRWMILRRLRKKAANILEDDKLLSEEGVHKLSYDALLDANHYRGLPFIDATDAQLSSQLRVWLAIDNIDGDPSLRAISAVLHRICFLHRPS